MTKDEQKCVDDVTDLGVATIATKGSGQRHADGFGGMQDPAGLSND